MSRMKLAMGAIAALFASTPPTEGARHTNEGRGRFRNCPRPGDQRNADKSKRVMRRERGSQPEHAKARSFYRALKRQRKAKSRYCNNINPGTGKLVKT